MRMIEKNSKLAEYFFQQKDEIMVIKETGSMVTKEEAQQNAALGKINGRANSSNNVNEANSNGNKQSNKLSSGSNVSSSTQGKKKERRKNPYSDINKGN